MPFLILTLKSPRTSVCIPLGFRPGITQSQIVITLWPLSLISTLWYVPYNAGSIFEWARRSWHIYLEHQEEFRDVSLWNCVFRSVCFSREVVTITCCFVAGHLLSSVNHLVMSMSKCLKIDQCVCGGWNSPSVSICSLRGGGSECINHCTHVSSLIHQQQSAWYLGALMRSTKMTRDQELTHMWPPMPICTLSSHICTEMNIATHALATPNSLHPVPLTVFLFTPSWILNPSTSNSLCPSLSQLSTFFPVSPVSYPSLPFITVQSPVLHFWLKSSIYISGRINLVCF